MTAAPGLREGFRDRRQAGRELGDRLLALQLVDPIVVALPRGGVPVGFEVARALGAPLDIALVRKIGAPGHPELGVGAISEDGQVILDAESISALGIRREQLREVIDAERRELERRRRQYRGERGRLEVAARTVVLVDDGIATGGTAIAAGRALRAGGSARVILATPVGPLGLERALGGEFDEIVCLLEPRHFGGVGRWYEDFAATSDSEVIELLEAGSAAGDPGAARPRPARFARGAEASGEEHVTIAIGESLEICGDLNVPGGATGLVIFAHGSGSSRRSPRNRAVAAELNAAGLATLLLDLLTEAEAAERGNVFDLDLLAVRLLAATTWAERRPGLEDLPIGYFGASTGAGAALAAAAAAPGRIGAIVSRGGRPDLAGVALPRVTAPTLLIVGGADRAVLRLNQMAAEGIAGPCEVAIVEGAGHLFEEPGALERVAELATAWFSSELAAAGPKWERSEPPETYPSAL